jgi:FHA domain-containing protein
MMSNDDPKRTVILAKNKSSDNATVILNKDELGLAAQQPNRGGVAPTQIIGPGGVLQNAPQQAAPSNAMGGNNTARAYGTIPQGGQSAATPGYASATRILMPEARSASQGDTHSQHPDATAKETFNPVVGWLVVTSGPGRGEFRAIRYGNNSIGRHPGQRIVLDFGDTAISAEEQAYIRYQPESRRFMLIPNNAKTNVTTHNQDEPMGPVELKANDTIGFGITKLRFIPLCSSEFEWSAEESAK